MGKLFFSTSPIVSLVNIFGFGPYRPIALIYFQNDVGMNAAQYGLNLSIAFAGLAVGSLIAGYWIKLFGSGRIFIGGLIIMGIATIAISIVPWIIVIYSLSAVRAFGNSLIIISYTTLLQSQAKDEQLGRVFSTMSVISEGIRPLSVIAGTTLAEVTGSQLTIVVSGVFFLIAALIASSNVHLRSKNDLTVPESA
ncbi:MAG: MFS transporter [Mariprofundales bacterium]